MIISPHPSFTSAYINILSSHSVINVQSGYSAERYKQDCATIQKNSNMNNKVRRT
jgi:hypothetical protein